MMDENKINEMVRLLKEAKESLHIHASNLEMDDYDEDAEGVRQLCREMDYVLTIDWKTSRNRVDDSDSLAQYKQNIKDRNESKGWVE